MSICSRHVGYRTDRVSAKRESMGMNKLSQAAPYSHRNPLIATSKGLQWSAAGTSRAHLSPFSRPRYPPSQRRLGEIYDSGNSAVARNYSESIRWYEKARQGGEEVPKPQSPYLTFTRNPTTN